MLSTLGQLIWLLLGCIVVLIGVLAVIGIYLRTRQAKPPTIAFFHPYANNGGGGERVLYQCIHAIQRWNSKIPIVVYTGDTIDGETICRNACERFHLPPFKSQPKFIHIKSRHYLEPSNYPYFTMFGQSIGSIIVACEALYLYTPTLFIDTTGYAFTYPIARFLYGCYVSCYTHYPTISTDMLQLVYERRPTYNNNAYVSSNIIKSTIKLCYYYLFTVLYSLAGRCSSCTLVNSSWTASHINKIWRVPHKTHIVFPPCDTSTLQSIPLKRIPTQTTSLTSEYREPLIISIGQFRPEKDHTLQIKAFATYLQQNPTSNVRLILIGGVRDNGDQTRVDALKQLIIELKIESKVEFVINAPFSTLVDYVSRGAVGIHTMWNEHFGIGVVEFMAAGLIPLAHNSGGPKADIVVNYEGKATGFLASTSDEYAAQLSHIFHSSFTGSSAMQSMRERARLHASTFSDEVFLEHTQRIWSELWASIVEPDVNGKKKQ